MSERYRRFSNDMHAPGDSGIKIVKSDGTVQAITLTQQEFSVDVGISDSNAIGITLPDAALMIGRTVSVYVSSQSSTGAVTVTGPGAGTDYSLAAMDAAGDNTVVRSDGLRWVALTSTVA